MQTETQLLRQLELLTEAVVQLAQAMGTRLDRTQLAERLGVHRNTLPKRFAEPGFPPCDRHGRWLLADLIAWEAREFSHNRRRVRKT